MSRKQSQTGFSLIELLITVAIVGILSAIAIPAYTSHMIKANRAAAQAFMLSVANKEEQYLADARQYLLIASNSVFANAPDAGTPGLSLPVPKEVDDYYNVTVTGAARSFTITASPKSGTRQAPDGDLTLTNTGAKSPADKW